MMECCLYRLERMKWSQEIEEEKLVLYRQIKQDFVGEVCAKCCKPYQSVLARLRGGTLPLMLTRRNFATDARVRKVQKTKNSSL